MKLSVMDRVQLLSIMPKEGNFVTLRIVRDLQRDLSFTEAEMKEVGMHIDKNNRYAWEKNIDKEVEIGEVALGIIKAAFDEYDKQGKMNMYTLDLYERMFVS